MILKFWNLTATFLQMEKPELGAATGLAGERNMEIRGEKILGQENGTKKWPLVFMCYFL